MYDNVPVSNIMMVYYVICKLIWLQRHGGWAGESVLLTDHARTTAGRDSLAHLEIHSLAHLRNSLTYAPGKSLTCAPRCGGVVGWGGVGWDNNVHVPVHPQAQQPHHLSCCPADTGSDGGVGWGGIITFMFPCTHRHSNLIIFLAVLQTQAVMVGWGGVGWGGVG